MPLGLSKNYELRSPLHPALQDDCRTDFIHEGFVAASHSPDSALEHRAMSNHAGITFVPHLDGDFREGGLQLVYEPLHPRQVVTVSSVCLARQSHHKAFHVFASHIVLQKSHQARCLHRGQSSCDNLQRVRHSQTGATDPIID